MRPRDGGMWSAALAPRSRRSATAAESARNSYAAPTPAAGDGAGLPFLPALAFVMMPRRAAPVRDALPRRRQLLEGGKRGHARISSPPASIGAFLSSLLGTSPATHGYCCRYREETRCHANPVTIPPGAWWARMRAPTAARTSSSRSSSSPTLFPSSFLHVDRCTRRPRQLILWPPRSLLGLGRAGRLANPAASPLYPANLAARPPQASSPGTSRRTVTSTSTSTPPLAGSHAMSRADKLVWVCPAMRQPPRLRATPVPHTRKAVHSQGAQPVHDVHGV